MNPNRFDRFIQNFGTVTNRRTLLQGAAALGITALVGATRPNQAAAKTLCRKNGISCKKKSKRCKAEYCLKAPFTIEARWNNATSDHDTIVFVPNKEGSSLDSPFITQHCVPGYSDCEEEVYPYICVSQDALGPGHEITTVRRLLPGLYEYWIELAQSVPAGDVEVILRNSNGRVIRSWSSPANPDGDDEYGWHVFNINGARRSITSIDEVFETNNTSLLNILHTPHTKVCPGGLP